MSRNQTTVVVLAALLAGFLGGILTQPGMNVLAQTGPAESIEAQQFRLVDASGNVLGVIKPMPTVFSADRSGAGPFGTRPDGAGSGAIVLFNSLGQVIWTAPETIAPPARVRPLVEPN